MEPGMSHHEKFSPTYTPTPMLFHAAYPPAARSEDIARDAALKAWLNIHFASLQEALGEPRWSSFAGFHRLWHTLRELGDSISDLVNAADPHACPRRPCRAASNALGQRGGAVAAADDLGEGANPMSRMASGNTVAPRDSF